MTRPSPAGIWTLAWTGAFAAVLVPTFPFAWVVTADGGRGGLVAAVALTFAVGVVAVRQSPRLRAPLVVGGAVTAVLCLHPGWLPYSAALLSAVVAQHLGITTAPSLSEWAAFVIAGLTYALLLLVGLVCVPALWLLVILPVGWAINTVVGLCRGGRVLQDRLTKPQP